MPRKYLLTEFEKEEDALPNYLRALIYKYRTGYAIFITGGQGAKIGNGKSVTARTLALAIDPTWNESRLCYTPYQFLKVLEKIKPGEVLILEEGEIAASNRKWQTISNNAIADSISVFRYKRCVAIFVTPVANWLESRVRQLITFRGMPTLTIENGKKVGYLRFYKIRTDDDGDKIYKQNLSFWDNKNRKAITFKKYKVNLPPEEIMERCDKKDEEFKNEIIGKRVKEALDFEEELLGRKTHGGLAQDSINALVEKLLTEPLIKEQLVGKIKIIPPMIRLVNPQIQKEDARAVATIINARYGEKKNAIPK
jgi:hypothetical protein